MGKRSHLSDLVAPLLGVGLRGLPVADAHHFGQRDGGQRLGPRVLLLQVLHHFVLLRLDLGLQLLAGLPQLLLGLLQRALVVGPDLVPQALLLLPVGARRKVRYTMGVSWR